MLSLAVAAYTVNGVERYLHGYGAATQAGSADAITMATQLATLISGTGIAADSYIRVPAGVDAAAFAAPTFAAAGASANVKVELKNIFGVKERLYLDGVAATALLNGALSAASITLINTNYRSKKDGSAGWAVVYSAVIFDRKRALTAA